MASDSESSYSASSTGSSNTNNSNETSTDSTTSDNSSHGGIGSWGNGSSTETSAAHSSGVEGPGLSNGNFGSAWSSSDNSSHGTGNGSWTDSSGSHSSSGSDSPTDSSINFTDVKTDASPEEADESFKSLYEGTNKSFDWSTFNDDSPDAQENFNGGASFAEQDKSKDEAPATQSLEDIPWTFTDDTQESKRSEKSIEDYYMESLAGQNGMTALDQASGALKEGYTYTKGEDAAQKAYDKAISKGKSEEDAQSAAEEARSKASYKAGSKYDKTYDQSAISNAYAHFNDKDMQNEQYSGLVEAAQKGFGDKAQEAIQAAGKGKSAYAKEVNQQAKDSKNAYGSSAQNAKEQRTENKSGELQSIANNASRASGFINNIGDSAKASLSNAGYNITNVADDVYTFFGGVNSYGNTWADTHNGNLTKQEGDARNSDKNYIGRVGSNIVQGAKNVGDKVDTFFGGANKQTGLSSSGMQADRNGDGKVSFGERLTNMAQRAFMGKDASKYDVNGNGKIDSSEAVVGALNHMTDFNLIGDNLVDKGKEQMKNNGGKWYNSLAGGAKVVGGYILNALNGAVNVATNPLSAVSTPLHGATELALNNAKDYGGFENVPKTEVSTANGPNNMYNMFDSRSGGGMDLSSGNTNANLSTANAMTDEELLEALKKAGLSPISGMTDWDTLKNNSMVADADKIRKKQMSISDERLKDYVMYSMMEPKVLDLVARLMAYRYQPKSDLGAITKTRYLMTNKI